MKNRSTGRLGRLSNAVALSGNDARRGHLRGFTLIELLVVVLIIGILSAIALPQYQVAVGKAKAMKNLTRVRALMTARDSYYLANGVYPKDVRDLDIGFGDVKEYGKSQKITNDTTVVSVYFNDGTECIVTAGAAAACLAADSPYLVANAKNEIWCGGLKSALHDKICKSLSGGGATKPHDGYTYPLYELKF